MKYYADKKGEWHWKLKSTTYNHSVGPFNSAVEAAYNAWANRKQ